MWKPSQFFFSSATLDFMRVFPSIKYWFCVLERDGYDRRQRNTIQSFRNLNWNFNEALDNLLKRAFIDFLSLCCQKKIPQILEEFLAWFSLNFVPSFLENCLEIFILQWTFKAQAIFKITCARSLSTWKTS